MKNKKLKSRVIGILRKSWVRDKVRTEVLGDARIERGKYLCEQCKTIIGPKEIDIDHKEPVIPLTGWVSFDDYIERLFCGKDNLRVLCKDCHKSVTKVQTEQRAIFRRLKKEKGEEIGDEE